MTRSRLADEYMSFQGSIESGANNMCRNCFEEYENSEPGAIKDAIGDTFRGWTVTGGSDEQMEDLRIQQQRNEAEMDLSERLFGDRKFQLKNASSDEPFESAWSVVKGAKKERSCDACGKDVPMGQGAHLERDHMNKPGEHGWYCDKCAEKGEMY